MKTDEVLISNCENSGCGWKCCNFGRDGHIIMLPNEYEKADSYTGHLEVIDDNYNGGKKVKCRALNTSICDGGYKPIQCAVYPLWVTSETDAELVKSTKCPLSHDVLNEHSYKSLTIISNYKNSNPDVDVESFIKSAEVDRYEKWLSNA